MTTLIAPGFISEERSSSSAHHDKPGAFENRPLGVLTSNERVRREEESTRQVLW